DEGTVRTTMKQEQRNAQAEMATYEERQWCAYKQSNAKCAKCERYCRKQRELLRQLADLMENERAMLEVDHAQDQVMTAFKLALINLVMWTRDRSFPPAHVHATWHRLEPFFRLPGADRVGGRNRRGAALPPTRSAPHGRSGCTVQARGGCPPSVARRAAV